MSLPPAMTVGTISEKSALISARNGLKVKADFTFANHPPLDLLIVPGGYGAERIEIKNLAALRWIQEQAKLAKITASVCTGAFLLAEAGVITNQRVTTHAMDQKELQEKYPLLQVVSDTKFVEVAK